MFGSVGFFLGDIGGLSFKSFHSLMTAATPRIRRSILSYMAAMSSCEGGQKMLQRFPSSFSMLAFLGPVIQGRKMME